MIAAMEGVGITGAIRTTSEDRRTVEYHCQDTNRTGRISLIQDGRLIAQVFDSNSQLLWRAEARNDDDPSHREWAWSPVTLADNEDRGDIGTLDEFIDWLTSTRAARKPIDFS